MKASLAHLGCALILAFTPSASANVTGTLNVRDFGAAGDGVAMDTAAVQHAINACSERGGGTVYLPAGAYLCGSLHLKSQVTLWLDNGATILGSPDDDDYDPYETLGFENDSDRETSYFHHALIWGEEVEHIAIVGQGTIDGNRRKRGGPKPIALKRCQFVEIRGIHIVNAPNYCISMLGTDYVNIDGVTIRDAHCDGIDPDSCKNVRIANCHIESWDDAIVPKASFTLGERRATENITVTNCYLSTACNAFKLGTESGGDFKRIAVSNCVMTGLKGKRPAISGVSLESVDGSNIDGVAVSNLTMIDCRAPIFLRLGNRGRDMETPTPGSLKNVTIDNVVATNATLQCSIAGIPEHDVENVSLSNIQITFSGGAPYQSADLPIPEVEGAYPEAEMFGAVPVYGLFVRHARGVTLTNVNLRTANEFWRIPNADERTRWDPETMRPTQIAPGTPGHAALFDNVRDLQIQMLRADTPEGAPVLRFVNVQDATITNCTTTERTSTFLQVQGEATAGIGIIACDLRRAATALELLTTVRDDAVRIVASVE